MPSLRPQDPENSCLSPARGRIDPLTRRTLEEFVSVLTYIMGATDHRRTPGTGICMGTYRTPRLFSAVMVSARNRLIPTNARLCWHVTRKPAPLPNSATRESYQNRKLFCSPLARRSDFRRRYAQTTRPYPAPASRVESRWESRCSYALCSIS